MARSAAPLGSDAGRRCRPLLGVLAVLQSGIGDSAERGHGGDTGDVTPVQRRHDVEVLVAELLQSRSSDTSCAFNDERAQRVIVLLGLPVLLLITGSAL